MEWISIEDQLPELNHVVLISAGKFVNAGWLTGSKKYPFAFLDPDELDSYNADDDTVKANAWMAGKVTHWSPMPAPPSNANVTGLAPEGDKS